MCFNFHSTTLQVRTALAPRKGHESARAEACMAMGYWAYCKAGSYTNSQSSTVRSALKLEDVKSLYDAALEHYLQVCLSICLSICPSIYLSVCLFVCLCACLCDAALAHYLQASALYVNTHGKEHVDSIRMMCNIALVYKVHPVCVRLSVCLCARRACVSHRPSDRPTNRLSVPPSFHPSCAHVCVYVRACVRVCE